MPRGEIYAIIRNDTVGIHKEWQCEADFYTKEQRDMGFLFGSGLFEIFFMVMFIAVFGMIIVSIIRKFSFIFGTAIL